MRKKKVLDFCEVMFRKRWPGSSVGIATDYGLDGPRSNPGRDEIFHFHFVTVEDS